MCVGVKSGPSSSKKHNSSCVREACLVIRKWLPIIQYRLLMKNGHLSCETVSPIHESQGGLWWQRAFWLTSRYYLCIMHWQHNLPIILHQQIRMQWQHAIHNHSTTKSTVTKIMTSCKVAEANEGNTNLFMRCNYRVVTISWWLS